MKILTSGGLDSHQSAMRLIIRSSHPRIHSNIITSSRRKSSYSHSTSTLHCCSNCHTRRSLAIQGLAVFHTMPSGILVRGPTQRNGRVTHRSNSHNRNRNVGSEGHRTAGALKPSSIPTIHSDGVVSQWNKLKEQPSK